MRVSTLALHVVASLAVVGAATAAMLGLGVTSPTTVALAYLLVVLFVASSSTLPVAVTTSVGGMLSLNYFFMAPVGTFVIEDAHNWVALAAFLIVAVVATHLSSAARARAREAVERRNEVARLFDLSRDVLLTTDGEGATAAVARHVARRFELPIASLAVPADAGGWTLAHGGESTAPPDDPELDRAWAAARGGLEFDANTRSYGGHRTVPVGTGSVVVVPVRVGVRPVGLAILGGRTIDPGTADAIAGVVAIALERARFLEERRQAELSRQRADLTSALLAALGHDLRTPLTAIRVAVTNASDPELPPEMRTGQTALAVAEIDRLARLLQEILDMARIEAHAVHADRQWVTAAAVVEAALAHTGHALAHHRLVVDADETTELQVDPRLTSSALAHVLENAAQYAPADTSIGVSASAGADGLRMTVTDEGPGLRPEDMERLFDPFVRGSASRHAPAGTGLGLAITRGLLAAEGGRIWADHAPGGGARFTIAIPAACRPAPAQEPWS